MGKRILPTSEIDDKIINILTYDTDLTFREIAEKLELNASTVRKRILSMKRRGVIRRFMVEVDEERLGRKLNASVAVDVDPTKYIGVVKSLTAMPQVAMAFQTSGGHDIFLILWTRDRDSLAQIIKEIGSIEGIAGVIPSIIVERLK